MADIFCDFASGDDADDGSTRALAKKTLAAALTAAGAGGRVGVKNDSAESQASAMTLTSPGTAASPTNILCIDWTSDTFASNALSTGASVVTTGNNAINFNGYANSDGISYTAGNSTGTANMVFQSTSSWKWVFLNCTMKIGSTGAGAIQLGRSGLTTQEEFCIFKNVIAFFTGATQRFVPDCKFTWEQGSLSASGTAPTTLFIPLSNNKAGRITVSGVDLSFAGAGKNLVDVSTYFPAVIEFLNCKLGSSVSITTGTPPTEGVAEVRVVNSDSADTNYRFQGGNPFLGTITQESTIVRTGGASDGTTPVSRKMVTTANSKFYAPLVSDPIDIWLETVGAYTGTIEIVTDGVTLTDAEAWLEVEHLGTSGFPLSSFAHDRASNILSTPSNQTSSSQTWTTTGLSSPVKQSLDVSFTTAEKGWARFMVHLAKASTTMYFDPEVNGLGITSGRQWQGASYINEGAAGGGGLLRSGGFTGGMQRT